MRNTSYEKRDLGLVDIRHMIRTMYFVVLSLDFSVVRAWGVFVEASSELTAAVSIFDGFLA